MTDLSDIEAEYNQHMADWEANGPTAEEMRDRQLNTYRIALEAGNLSAVPALVRYCNKLDLPIPEWGQAWVMFFLDLGVKSQSVPGIKKGRGGSPYKRHQQRMRDGEIHGLVRELMERFGKEEGGPVRYENVFRVAARYLECKRTGEPFDPMEPDSNFDVDPPGVATIKNTYERVAKAINDGFGARYIDFGKL